MIVIILTLLIVLHLIWSRTDFKMIRRVQLLKCRFLRWWFVLTLCRLLYWRSERRLLSFHLQIILSTVIKFILVLKFEVFFGCRHFLLVVDQTLIRRILPTASFYGLVRDFRSTIILLFKIYLLSIHLSLPVLFLHDLLARRRLYLSLTFGPLLGMVQPTNDKRKKKYYNSQDDRINDVYPLDCLLLLSDPANNYCNVGILLTFFALRKYHNVWHLDGLGTRLNCYL